MNIYILNNEFERIGIIDYCASIIWTRRYCQTGDFELYIPVTAEALELIKINRLVQREDAPESLMIIKNITLKTDAEAGDFLTVTGPSAEGYIGQRVIWSQTNLSGTIAQAITQLLNENIINPTESARAIPGVTIGDVSAAETESLTKQITGDNLLEAITGILNEYKLGFNFLFNSGALAFNIYQGIDRSFNQSENPRVIFSPEFDNFITSEYNSNAESYANVALVAGEGEGAARKTQEVGTATGAERVELYVDARDISSDTEGGTLTPTEYNALLVSRGQEKLAEAPMVENYTGEVEPNTSFIFGTDYQLGDIVEIKNEFGAAAAARITEVIESWDENGHTVIPTFNSKEA